MLRALVQPAEDYKLLQRIMHMFGTSRVFINTSNCDMLHERAGAVPESVRCVPCYTTLLLTVSLTVSLTRVNLTMSSQLLCHGMSLKLIIPITLALTASPLASSAQGRSVMLTRCRAVREIHGSLGRLQCSGPCCDDLIPVNQQFLTRLEQEPNWVPRCSQCNAACLRPNVMIFGNTLSANHRQPAQPSCSFPITCSELFGASLVSRSCPATQTVKRETVHLQTELSQ